MRYAWSTIRYLSYCSKGRLNGLCCHGGCCCCPCSCSCTCRRCPACSCSCSFSRCGCSFAGLAPSRCTPRVVRKNFSGPHQGGGGGGGGWGGCLRPESFVWCIEKFLQNAESHQGKHITGLSSSRAVDCNYFWSKWTTREGAISFLLNSD